MILLPAKFGFRMNKLYHGIMSYSLFSPSLFSPSAFWAEHGISLQAQAAQEYLEQILHPSNSGLQMKDIASAWKSSVEKAIQVFGSNR